MAGELVDAPLEATLERRVLCLLAELLGLLSSGIGPEGFFSRGFSAPFIDQASQIALEGPSNQCVPAAE